MAARTPIITLEEHFMSAAAEARPHKTDAALRQMPGLWAKFTELGPLRLDDMDAGQVTLQVISHGPGDLTPDQCRAANDQLAGAVRENPGRFAGFAALPMQHPEAAAAELRRACSPGMGFLGALVDSHTEAGAYYEGPEYDALWAAACDLDVPVYIHPTWPTEDVFATSYYRPGSALPEPVAASIAAFGFGWHGDVAVHVLRLYAGGVFDRFPALKVVVGHFGEMIPFMLQRIERIAGRWGRARSFREVWDANVWLTTSGNWALDPLACVLRNTSASRIMYSVDYPFASSADGLRWLEELEGSGLVSRDELEGIRWRNAAALLKVDVGRGSEA